MHYKNGQERSLRMFINNYKYYLQTPNIKINAIRNLHDNNFIKSELSRLRQELTDPWYTYNVKQRRVMEYLIKFYEREQKNIPTHVSGSNGMKKMNTSNFNYEMHNQYLREIGNIRDPNEASKAHYKDKRVDNARIRASKQLQQRLQERKYQHGPLVNGFRNPKVLTKDQLIRKIMTKVRLMTKPQLKRFLTKLNKLNVN